MKTETDIRDSSGEDRSGARRPVRRTPEGASAAKNRRASGSRAAAGNASPAAKRKRAASGGRARAERRARRKYASVQPLAESFSHAFDGIAAGVAERNMKIHCMAALLVVVFGFFLRISVTEWCLCFILFGLVMGLELVNTAVESVVDLVTNEYKPLAKRAKDTAAGAVLIAAVMAAAAGLVIFIPRLVYFFRNIF